MRAGSRCGVIEVRGGPTVGLFVNERGYTSVAMAVALLVSLTLAFSAASAQWALARSAEVQEVADAAAMAGENSVAAFSTIVQVLDACVLSMGLTGVLVYGAGLVISAIPFMRAKAPAVLDAGRRVLDARREFARSAAQGIERLERVLPAIVMANSASCVFANCRGGISYVGCAIPFPQRSETDYSFLEEEVDTGELDASTERLREATEVKERAEKRAIEAKERAWRADCVDDPMCMRSRAQTLAGLSGASNPDCPLASEWRFGYALSRARNYYRARSYQEAPLDGTMEELSRSAARSAFYSYACDVLGAATCEEDGKSVVLDLPELPHNNDTVRATSLYTDALWPCTDEEGGRSLHSSLSCVGATGPSSGHASLADLDAGTVTYCSACGMDLGVMGSVANASTNIDNGFEHYWRVVVEESREYQRAHEEAREAERRMREAAEEGADAFERAVKALSVERPKVCPAGAWGCVSVVMRKGGTTVPSALTRAFVSGTDLPPGVAMSAATLAPDDATDGNTVLSRVFDGLSDSEAGLVDLVGSVTDLWGKLLVGYGSAYGGVSDAAGDLLEGIGSLFGEEVASWLRSKVTALVEGMGFEPADMRHRKPVLVQSQKVLDQVGLTSLGQLRALVEALPPSADEITAESLARIMGELGAGDFTVATLPLPGGGESPIPLTVDLSTLVGVP